MQANYWYDKWEKGEIAFHQFKGSPLLKAHFTALELPQGSRIFVPLCGKTRDIAWLLANDLNVVGAELHEPAVQQLFHDMEIQPEVSQREDLGLVHYHATVNDRAVDVYVGDIFQLTRDLVGEIDGIYDRAALVALPSEVRAKYTSHIRKLSGTAPQLLISFDYQQHLMPGPPHCVNAKEIAKHYADDYAIQLLASVDVEGGLKGKLPANEEVWLLKKLG